jgi:hypothetical protein
MPASQLVQMTTPSVLLEQVVQLLIVHDWAKQVPLPSTT